MEKKGKAAAPYARRRLAQDAVRTSRRHPPKTVHAGGPIGGQCADPLGHIPPASRGAPMVRHPREFFRI